MKLPRSIFWILLLGSPAAAQTRQLTRAEPFCDTRSGGHEGLQAISDALAEMPVVQAKTGARLGCEETKLGGAQTLASAHALDVPPDLQGGKPTCGFHALRMMMRYWDSHSATGEVIPGMEY